MNEPAIRTEDVTIPARDGYALAATAFAPPAPASTWVIVNSATAVLRMGEDMPAGVAQEWARWGRRPGYVIDAGGGALRPGYGRVAFPIRSYSFSDDPFAPPRAVEALLGFYSAARVARRALTPRDLG